MDQTINFDDRVRVISLSPNLLDQDKLIAAVELLVRRGSGGYVCFSTVHMVMESFDDDAYAARVNAADLIVTDGMPLVWMQRLMGRRDATRVRANDLMIALCQYAAANSMSVGFYGGKQAVIDAIKHRARNEMPNLNIAYAYSPPFRPLTDDEDAAIVDQINAAKPDILFMGLGCPKQENWMSAHRDRVSAVMLGVGASFDFFAGNVSECPPWLGRLGLEWLYRLYQEPRRLWRRYLILNPRFIWNAAKQLVRR